MNPELELARDILAELIGPAPAWHQRAACRGQGPGEWFKLGAPNQKALATCARCRVQTDCLETALSDPHTKGTWAGTSERQRDRIRKEHTTMPEPLEIRCRIIDPRPFVAETASTAVRLMAQDGFPEDLARVTAAHSVATLAMQDIAYLAEILPQLTLDATETPNDAEG